MKRILTSLLYLSAIFTVLPTLTSCGDWFDVSSEIDVKEDEMFKKESGFFDALIGVYATMSSGDLYGDKLTLCCLDIMAYNYKIGSQAPDLYTSLAKYDYKNKDVESVIKNVWGNMYNGIANANKIIDRLEKADRAIFEKGNYEMIKGEALALRAYLHFDLLRLFGSSEMMSNNEKWIPYVTKFGYKNTPYSTFKEVIEKTLADLNTAEDLLSNDIVLRPMERPTNVYVMNREIRLNLFAVKALKARVMLYGGKPKSEIYSYMESLFDLLDNNINYPRLTTRPQDIDKDKLIAQELIFSVYVDRLSDTAPKYFPSFTKDTELSNTKENLDNIFDYDNYKMQDARYELLFIMEDGLLRLRKFRQELGDGSKIKSRIPMLKLSEMYYIAAETASDAETAQKYINNVRAARRLDKLEFNSMEEINQYLLQEYRREFIGEGQLFYLYKRLNLPNIPDCELNLSERLTEVYRFPLPQQEDEWGEK